MGYQYSVDPAKMEIEGSSFIPSTSDTGPRAPRFERLEGASDKVRAAIWNEIYEEFKGS